MLKYIINRLLLIIPSLLIIIFCIFFILNITPGNPGRIILGDRATPEAVEALNEELGVNLSMMERFTNYLKGILHLDFGRSYRTHKPVFETLLPTFPTTLKIGLISSIVMALIGIPLGILSATRQYSVLDYSVTVSSLLLASLPSFLLASGCILIFSWWLRILPSHGIGSIKHYILPVLTLALPSAAALARYTRTSMLETMRQDYIRTARAKGAPERTVIFHHALKPSLLPVITILGMVFASSLGGALITEVVFGLPGVGNAILTAVNMKDAPVILGSGIALAVIYKVVMLLVDIIMVLVDPRLKSGMKGRK